MNGKGKFFLGTIVSAIAQGSCGFLKTSEKNIAVNYYGDPVSSCGYVSAVNSTEGLYCRR